MAGVPGNALFMRFIGRLLGLISHELNNHLAILRESIGLADDILAAKNVSDKKKLDDLTGLIRSLDEKFNTSGLEAAKTAAENGLRVALLERNTHPARIYRSCAQMFHMNMDSFYNERMYFSREKKKWVFPVNNFAVNYSGGYREFYALHFIAPNARERIEVGDDEANQSGRGIAAVVFDKGALLNGLFEEGRKAGVSYFLERNVVDARKTAEGIEVRTHRGEKFSGTFCIAADGVNSRKEYDATRPSPNPCRNLD